MGNKVMGNTVLTAFLLATLCTTFHSVAIADELIIPVGAQGASKASLERPANGISKQSVADRFGEPLSKTAAVGEPPISSWEYDQYIVYFEFDKVLHSVLKPDASQKLK